MSATPEPIGDTPSMGRRRMMMGVAGLTATTAVWSTPNLTNIAGTPAYAAAGSTGTSTPSIELELTYNLGGSTITSPAGGLYVDPGTGEQIMFNITNDELCFEGGIVEGREVTITVTGVDCTCTVQAVAVLPAEGLVRSAAGNTMVLCGLFDPGGISGVTVFTVALTCTA